MWDTKVSAATLPFKFCRWWLTPPAGSFVLAVGNDDGGPTQTDFSPAPITRKGFGSSLVPLNLFENQYVATARIVCNHFALGSLSVGIMLMDSADRICF